MSRKPVVGIDLGTTNSLVAVLQDGRPVLLPNALGETLTPSAVGVDDDGRLLVGAAARARAISHPEVTVLAFKRDMGTDRSYRLGGETYRPVDLSALVLAALKRDAEQALGFEIEEAIVTVPAYFGDAQRQSTKDAGAIAGLRVDRIVNEPTAAALAYGLHNLHEEVRAVVIDLGGGTFDVTVLEILEGVIEIQGSSGDARLGGEDFSDALADQLRERVARELGFDVGSAPTSLSRFREAADRAKERLTGCMETRFVVPGLRGAADSTIDVDLPLTRSDAERCWVSLLSRMRPPLERALRDAKMSPSAIDRVLLVGGATRMPCVRAFAAEVFGKMPLDGLPPDEAVALGASIQAGLKVGDQTVEDLVVTDIAPFTLGIATGSKVGSKVVSGLFSPILERGTVIPASRVERYVTIEDDQPQILIQVYQGEHSLCRDNHKLGEYSVQNLPRGPAGEVGVDVRFTYDANGILEVEMRVAGTDRTAHLVIESRPGKLTPEQIEEARRAMTRLKFHPRDGLPNRTALARADALFIELSGIERAELGQLIARFRAVLEAQDQAAIDGAREMLNAAVSALRR
jgi:molecular chaperone HscC